jgi:hypothetical protein
MGTEEQTERELRAAKNQALFREVNERLQGIAEAFQYVAGTATFTCECADPTCVSQVQMTMDDYEAVRQDPTHFLVLPGHVDPAVEDVVATGDVYVVIAKRRAAAEYSELADPRSREG